MLFEAILSKFMLRKPAPLFLLDVSDRSFYLYGESEIFTEDVRFFNLVELSLNYWLSLGLLITKSCLSFLLSLR